jgi:hypothetical protein
MPSVRKRSIAIKVNLTPELHERLRDVAAQLGQAPATLASIAIGAYVANLASSLGAGQRMVDNLSAHMGPQIVEQMKLLGDKS